MGATAGRSGTRTCEGQNMEGGRAQNEGKFVRHGIGIPKGTMREVGFRRMRMKECKLGGRAVLLGG